MIDSDMILLATCYHPNMIDNKISITDIPQAVNNLHYVITIVS